MLRAFALLVVVSSIACSPPATLGTREDGLTVGGHVCPQGAGDTQSNIPADGVFYISTFEGGAPMSCHGAPADGTSLYIADRDRWPCDSHIRITDPFPIDASASPPMHQSCVAQVSDRGPNICVEQAAGKAMIDASPAITEYLFGLRQSGWSDHREILVALTTDPLGCAPIAADASDGGTDGGSCDAGGETPGTACQGDDDCTYWQYCDGNGACEGLACGADDTACNAGLPDLGVVCGNAGVCTPGCHSDYDCLDWQSCDTSSGDGACR